MCNIKKLLAFLLALVMILGLAACGKEPEPTAPPPTDGQPVEQPPEESIGIVTLAGVSHMKLHYDTDGKIVVITDNNDTACFSQLIGTPCAEAVTQILQTEGGVYAESFLLIRHEINTLLPNENFLQEICNAAKANLGNLPIILSPAADQDDLGYFSSATAKAVLEAYLGNPADTSYNVSSSPVNGYYGVNVVTSGASANYVVGALYGSVELQTEVEDDFVEGMDDYIDFDALLDADPSGEAEIPAEEPPEGETELPTEEPPVQG